MNLAQLIEAGIAPSQARTFVGPLSTLCPIYGVNTPLREAMFVAQCGHESGGFARLEESFFYREAKRIASTFQTPFGWHKTDKAKQAAAIKRALPFESGPGRPSRSKALANFVYANRGGNGDEASGDGWKYRARGLIGTTFRDNYEAAGRSAGRDWVANPDELLEPVWAVTAALVYWRDNRLNATADARNVRENTRGINRGLAGLADRERRFVDAAAAFGA